ncbi:Lecithin:cholesterol/phospholipid:diacylglycerol acyltransferase [Cynara cardunculus var. scolymus]|uniref:Lecithin:cholesterol/phospholipid:diacylglycerol acyltransferase n=1 Tax=Cynara cardunculus var. scolymus TaxID=59895 RepID=A0A118JW41_CYNCS|nr:Lecithin:cholesterol/phospholipid:diacylglycerol acyltransferase [Cynara cardunculus var. scolymus]
MPAARRRKGHGGDSKKATTSEQQPAPRLDRKVEEQKREKERKTKDLNNKNINNLKKERSKRTCIDGCCWLIGFICSTWWFLLFLYNAMPASFPQYVTEAITGPMPDPPGVKMHKEGLKVKHPVIFVPGIVTGGLELWEGHPCMDGLFRKRLWGGTFGEIYKRPLCWIEHMSLDNETGLDPPGVRVRPVSGLVAADYFAAGYFVWAVLIANLARIGYEEKNMMTRTWDSTMSLIPKGGDAIWGTLDWSPEADHECVAKKVKKNETQAVGENGAVFDGLKSHNYGRIISFGKDVAELHSSKVERVDFRGNNFANRSCRDVWNEYHEMGIADMKAVADYKAFTIESVLELLEFVAPRMMKRGSAHYSYGIADNLEDPKLPNAPEMEIFSMYGVGLPTERSYIYKFSPTAECHIPFQIDTSAEGGNDEDCLRAGVYSVDGDETVPVLSAGFMCAKGWRGKTRFNPSGIKTYIREYDHAPPATLLEGRGTQSGNHVDIMGNFALIEDIIRVAAGATGNDLGGDQVYSDVFKWSERIKLRL